MISHFNLILFLSRRGTMFKRRNLIYVLPYAGMAGRNYGIGVEFLSPNITLIVSNKKQFESRQFRPDCYSSAEVVSRREGRVLP